jgi:hypothetical protein
VYSHIFSLKILGFFMEIGLVPLKGNIAMLAVWPWRLGFVQENLQRSNDPFAGVFGVDNGIDHRT